MSDKKITELKADSFRAAIAAGTAIIDFYDPWCGMCRHQAVLLDAMADEDRIPDGVLVGKVDVEAEAGLAAEFDICHLPTLIIFRDGVERTRFIGLQTALTLLRAIGE